MKLRPDEIINRALVELTPLAQGLPALLLRLADAQPGPQGSTMGATTAHGFSLDEDMRIDTEPVKLTAVEAQALTPDMAKADLAALVAAVGAIHTNTIRVQRVLARYHHVNHQATECPPDWCRNCYLDGQYHEPVGRDPKGHAYYDGLCKWCGQFQSEHGWLPTVKLLRRRHQGQRVLVTHIDEQRNIGMSANRR